MDGQYPLASSENLNILLAGKHLEFRITGERQGRGYHGFLRHSSSGDLSHFTQFMYFEIIKLFIT